jgi:hypothetical protein
LEGTACKERKRERIRDTKQAFGLLGKNKEEE